MGSPEMLLVHELRIHGGTLLNKPSAYAILSSNLAYAKSRNGI